MHGTVLGQSRCDAEGRLREGPTRENEMAAFDRLPATLRSLISFGPFNFRATDVEGALIAGHEERYLTRMIRLTWKKTWEAADLRWRKLGKGPYPHTAAKATLMVTEPIDAATPVEQRSKFYHRRQRKRMRNPTSFAPQPQRTEPQPPPPVIYL